DGGAGFGGGGADCRAACWVAVDVVDLFERRRGGRGDGGWGWGAGVGAAGGGAGVGTHVPPAARGGGGGVQGGAGPGRGSCAGVGLRVDMMVSRLRLCRSAAFLRSCFTWFADGL